MRINSNHGRRQMESLSSSPSWPRSFGMSMDLYSRSPSLRMLPKASSFEQDSLSGPPLITFQDDVAKMKNSELEKPLLSENVDRMEDGNSDSNGLYMQVPTKTLDDEIASFNGKNHLLGPSKVEGSSFLQATLNGMNALAGVGILSTPYAVSQGGWLGLSFLLLFAVVCCYTGFLLRHCLDSDPRIMNYPDIGQAAFGRTGRWIVSCLLYFELYAVAVEFLILEGDNLSHLFHLDSITIWGVNFQAENSFVILSAMVMLPTVWLRDLSFVAYVSATGVIATFLVFLAVLWVGLFDDVGFPYRGRLLNVESLPVAVGLYAFCYCGHAVFPSIYGSMNDNGKFSYVLILCFALCTLLYGGIALIGYLMFGDTIQSQVTLNLPSQAVATRVAILSTLVNPFAKYALTLTPLAAALEEFFPHSRTAKTVTIWGTAVRTLLVGSTVIVALSIPFFAYLMAFIGSFLSTTAAITIPCICYLKIFGAELSKRELCLIIIFIFVGLFASVVGTYSSVREILMNL